MLIIQKRIPNSRFYIQIIRRKAYVLFYLQVLFYFPAQAQNKNDLQHLENLYQSCLDKGEDMNGCARTYYLQMDSMLNVTYKKLRSTLNAEEQKQLKTEQLQWLQKRDKYFAENKKKINYSTGSNSPIPSDELMLMYDQHALFVQQRIYYMVNKLQKKENAQ
ncbi:lysozyme inhibitor LprI family protein [Aridibaculum aurantiacum]|uniref:lysozyme inhibitor LprI family protein n=1 Tax=Aridibaculum aurantiacum TaxID=2810307 RepID=UPI001A97B144|nr:lysozyme inhibitor LprI family protein [Aridibaculum aurantiacum]